MILSIVKCNVCGAIKQEANHWFYAETQPDSPDEVNAFITIHPWDYPAEEPGKIHLCGRACVIAKVSEFMGGKPEASNAQTA